MKYKKLTGVILKKQNYREADQIVTLWTKQNGKIRVLAKGVRRPASKLNFCLANLGICEVEVAGNHNLPTLIGIKSIRQFSSLLDNLKKAAQGFYAAELMLKMTADEHPNDTVYELLVRTLNQIDSSEIITNHTLVDDFALKLTEALGFGTNKELSTHREVVDFLETILERELKAQNFLMQV